MARHWRSSACADSSRACVDERVCARRCSSSRRCLARSMFSESEVVRASVLASVEGCAVLGAWVRPERSVAVERMSARSCFLGEERIRMLNVESSFGEAALGLLKESGGKGRHTVYLPGNEAATDRPGLECFVGVISGLAERL